MNMSWLDWSIVGFFSLVIIIIAFLAKSLNRSIADFLAGNRCVGRYLLTVADGMAGVGAITIVANFEKYYEAGFAGGWWGQVLAPIAMLMALGGFVIYRYRETRVMTMAQFFEVRYSRRFRIFSGILAYVSGVLNYGIFPAVSARFLIHFCGLPSYIDVLGFTIPTLAPVMLVLLCFSLVLVFSGGQVSVVITDFLQGQYMQITIIIVLCILMAKISWGDFWHGLSMAPEQSSRINPFKTSDTKGFNPLFFMLIAFLNIYGFKAWQGSQGYNAAAKSPHEAKMANLLGIFRGQVVLLLTMLVPLYIFAVLHLPQFADTAAVVNEALSHMPSESIQDQMRVPVGIAQLLPVGVIGMFAAMIIFATVSTDSSYLHSWGSILIQDVIMPFRKKPLSTTVQMRLLRISIFGVAAFAFMFSLFFPIGDFIYMYFQITGAIYLGGAGSAILGGLYWKRGTVEGAWAAMIIGSVLAVAGICLRNIVWPHFLPGLKESHVDLLWLQDLPERFPLDGVQMAALVAFISCASYVIFSLLSRRPPIDMDKLLHRGAYAIEEAGHNPTLLDKPSEPLRSLTFRERMWKRLGVNSDFTKGDKAIYMFKIGYTMLWFAVFIIGTIAALTIGISDATWEKYWHFKVMLIIALGLFATVWFLWGGFKDLFEMVRTLRANARDYTDDGSVSENEHLQEKD